MEDKTTVAYEQWRELIVKLLETYKTAREARYAETDKDDKAVLGNICKACVKMLDLLEGV